MPHSQAWRPARRHILILLVMLSALTLVILVRDGLQTMASAATTFVVTNTNDTGAGSLRQAILDANANPGADLITFNTGSGLQTITPASPLPDISDQVVIDGSTQPGFAGSPLIELRAISIPSHPNRGVLHITAGNTTVRGLIVDHFRDAGISIVTGGAITLKAVTLAPTRQVALLLAATPMVLRLTVRPTTQSAEQLQALET